MNFCSTKKCLHYASPAHGGWGVVRVGMLIPQSYQLFVCPFACGRHGAIGAIQQGLKDRLSYLYLDQSDIIDGYEDLIVESMQEFIKSLNDDVRVILIVVSCLDDLIGTDTISLRERLNKKYPKYTFQIGHMNPITGDTQSPPLVSIQRSIYELLEKREINNKLVVTIGNFEPLNEDNDIKILLKDNGYTLLHISETNTFDEFLDLARSSLNLVIAPSGLLSAKDMNNKLGIPYLFLPTSYLLEEIKAQTKEICNFLSIEVAEEYFEAKEKNALKLIEKAKDAMNGKKLIVSSSSTNRVFSLSLALLKYGFDIDTIFAQSIPKIEKNALKEIEDNFIQVQIKQVLHHSMINRVDNKEDYVAIGIEGSYSINSKHPVQMEGDHQMYGYQGLENLMLGIIESIENPKTIEELLDIYKLVI